jgi:hypothetical protein
LDAHSGISSNPVSEPYSFIFDSLNHSALDYYDSDRLHQIEP